MRENMTEFQIGVYKARAIAATEEFNEGMEHLFREGYDKLPKYIKEDYPDYGEISREDIALIDDINEKVGPKYDRLKKEIERRYGFEIQREDIDVFFIVQMLPDGSTLWFDGSDFDIDTSWMKPPAIQDGERDD